MKNIFFIIFINLLLAPSFIFAIQPGTIPDADDLVIDPSPVSKPSDFLDILAAVVRWLYTIFFIAAVAFIIFAAFTYLTANENSEKIAKAHKMIIYAAVAIGVALIAVGFSEIIKLFLENPSV